MTSDAPILLIGGTRGTGLLIARLLAQNGSPVRVLARDPDRAAQELGSKAEIVRGDLTQPATLQPAIAGARHIIFTAGARSGRPVTSARIRRTEYEGVINTLAAASRLAFAGRFLYMTSSGVGSRSFWTFALNLYKGNTLKWRARAETAIRASALQYTIVRAAMLTSQPGGSQTIEVTQDPLPLSPRYRVGRADVAAAFVAALQHPRTARATFDIVGRNGPTTPRWDELFDRLHPDEASPTRSRPFNTEFREYSE